MAKRTRLSLKLAAALLDGDGLHYLDGGYLRIYDGMQPSDADAAVSNQRVLAELQFASPAFDRATAGVARAKTLTPDTDAAATGMASWFRTFGADGTSVGYDGTVGPADANLVMSTTAIVEHAEVDVSSLSFSIAQE